MKIKKVLSLAFVTIFVVLMFSACSKVSSDPIKLAEALQEEDYTVSFLVDSEDIRDFAKEYDIEYKGIEYILCVTPENSYSYAVYQPREIGYFIYCEKTNGAKEMVDDIEKIARNSDFDENISEFTVERKGKVVFFGSSEIWDEMN